MSVTGLPDWDFPTPSSGEGANGFPDEPVTESAPESASVPAKIERADWDGSQGEPTEEVQLPAAHTDVAVGLDPSLVSRWQNEGGFEHNLRAAQNTATKVLSLADNPDGMSASFDRLPAELQSKIFDNLRLSAPYGENGA